MAAAIQEQKMHERATSKKRTAEVERELNMDDKEATPVEDVEMMLPPAEPTKPAQQEEQSNRPMQTKEKIFQELMRAIIENNKNI